MNRVRHNGEGIKKLLHAPQPKGGSLAASMYATHGARAAATAGHSQSPPSPPPLPLQQQQRHGSPSRCAAPPLVAASMRSPSPSVPSSSAEGMDVEAAEAVMVGRVMAVEELAEATAEEGEVGEEVLSAFQDPASALDARDGFAPIAESPEEDQEAEADAARAVAAEGEGDAPIQQLAVAAPAAAKQQEQQEQETPQDVLPTPLQQQPPQPRRKSLPTQVAAAAAAGEEEEEAAAAGMPVSDEGDDAAEAAALAPFPSEKGKVRKGFVSRMRKAFGLRR